MADALSRISTRATPQSQQADPRQVPNSAGGHAFTVPQNARLHRFLTLGTEGGTFYATERELTRQNATALAAMIKSDARQVVDEAVAISEAGRAPRNNPALFAVAATAGLATNVHDRRHALREMHKVARTGTHLFTFLGYAEQFRGWGRGMRRAVAEWYLTAQPIDRLDYQILKYRQREGWTHRDALRLSHPAGVGAYKALFDWICKREADLDEHPLVEAFAKAQAATTESQWVKLIQDNPALSHEMLPNEALKSPEVWVALISNGMPQTALMRQLPRLTRLKVVGPGSAMTRVVVGQLGDQEKIRRARVHPINILVALRTYAEGQSARGKGTWVPSPQVIDALSDAFYLAYGNIRPSGKRTLLALDVSGSMMQPVSGLPISCREASAAIALVTAATEPETTIVGFTSGGSWGYYGGSAISVLPISAKQRLDDVLHRVSGLSFGGTDCALPMMWALENRLEFDHFQVLTDNETWAGRIHPHQALASYRQKMGIGARQSVIGMTATDFTIADPDDPGTLDVAGFDSAVPQLVADFARGDI